MPRWLVCMREEKGKVKWLILWQSRSDVLGAGNGWAQSILLHEGARATLEAFFKRPDTFGLGVCNGCQAFTRLRELIPGTEHWPTFGTYHLSCVFLALVNIDS